MTLFDSIVVGSMKFCYIIEERESVLNLSKESVDMISNGFPKTKGLKKRFSIGLTLRFMSEEEYKSIIDEFNEYIYEIYFSPPFGDKFHSRKEVAKGLKPSPETEEKVFRILTYAVDKGIQLTLALNTKVILLENVLKAAERVLERVNIGSFTTLMNFAGPLKCLYPDIPIKCSYNEGVKNPSELEQICSHNLFSSIVLGNSTLRNNDLFRQAVTKGLEVELLLNNGCTFACNNFCFPSSHCEEDFMKSLESHPINFLYSRQSIIPREFFTYYIENKNIRHFKISNRPCTYNYLSTCLKSYIQNIDFELIKRDIKYYRLWARLVHFNRFLGFLDFDKICEYKDNLWEHHNSHNLKAIR